MTILTVVPQGVAGSGTWTSNMAAQCLVCGKRVKPANGIFLFLRPNGSEVWLCGQKCADKYNGGDDEASVCKQG